MPMPASAVIGGTTNRKWRIPVNEGPWPTIWQNSGNTMTKTRTAMSATAVPAKIASGCLLLATPRGQAGRHISAAAAPIRTRSGSLIAR